MYTFDLDDYFDTDSSHAYNGTALAGLRNVIIVAIDYRLGALGKFNTYSAGG